MSFSCEHVRSMPLTPTDGRAMQDKLMIPVVFKIFKILERRGPIECSVELFGAAGSGKLADHKTFKNYVTCLQIASAIPLSSTVWYSKFGNIPELHGLGAFSSRNLHAPVWHSYFVVRGAITPSLKV
jgi:hypothetical protein